MVRRASLQCTHDRSALGRADSFGCVHFFRSSMYWPDTLGVSRRAGWHAHADMAFAIARSAAAHGHHVVAPDSRAATSDGASVSANRVKYASSWADLGPRGRDWRGCSGIGMRWQARRLVVPACGSMRTQSRAGGPISSCERSSMWILPVHRGQRSPQGGVRAPTEASPTPCNA